MAESAVTFLVDKLSHFLQEEVRLLSGLREEVEYIRDELERIRAFLKVADATEECDEEIKVWVKQLRDIAYHTEDVLDEFMIRLAHHHGQGFYASLCKIFYSIKDLKTRHWIASKIQGIKSRVGNICEGHQRYRFKFNIPEQGFSSTSGSTTGDNTWCDLRGNALLLEEAEVVGIDKPKKQLIQWLVEGNPLTVISVVGMGGLGKTTMAKKVYDDAKVKKHFQSHVWITVSQSFKLVELLKDTIQQLFNEIKQPVPLGVETMNNQGLKAVINEFLQDRSYLLVLDDVWSINDWDVFKYVFPNNNCGSRIILTTRVGEVASRSSMEFHGDVYELKPLSPEDSWTLFCRKTFYENFCPPLLVELAESMLRRCEGLPLAIVAVSGVLATKDKNRIDEWGMVHQSLGVELEGDDRFKNVKKVLSLSYDDLPSHLKSCFMYLSIFPSEHLIERMRLIRLWIAEGFVEEKEGKTLEEVAEGYLNQLFNRSLLQVAGTTIDGQVKTCRIHDLLREIVLSKSTSQNFVAIANQQHRRWPGNVRRLSVDKSMGNVRENEVFSQLRSLLMFGVVDLPSNSSVLSLFSGGLRLLKVLDLRGTPLESFPNEITKLFHLRYLSLRNTKVKMLPSSIGKLQNLETLDLKQTYVTELPVGILKLQRLRHLLVYRYGVESALPFYCVQSCKVPPGIGGLVSLQKLCFIESDQGSSNLLGEIGRLSQLRRFAIKNCKRDDGVALCSSLEKLSNLRSLSISSVGDDEFIDLQHLSSSPGSLRLLQRLYLTGRLEKMPGWISSLHSLVKLRLRWSRLRDDPLEALGILTNLVELRLVEAYDGQTLCCKSGGFQRLKVLRLDKLEGLRLLRLEEGAVPKLEELIVMRCNLLERVPSGIEHHTNLKSLYFFDMPNDFFMTLKLDREGGDYWKIAHIPEVYMGSAKDGRVSGRFL
ncbi:hypothetical protein L1049_001694 [Liquidambar formosana]|uniref:Disease resistance protein RPM1-like n=1 Tax=Liquidambar formosana TaxID=63359 RepID=A0AAP0QXK1_LIQFO